MKPVPRPPVRRRLHPRLRRETVAIVRASWNHVFLEELRDFPFGRKDDQVDALSRAFTMLTTPGRRHAVVSMPFLAR